MALVSIQESYDVTTPEGEAMMNMITTFSQLERRLIGQRTKDALRYLKSQGKALGSPGYGYDIKKGRRKANKKEQQVIAHIRALRAEGLPYRAIADRLNSEGVLTKRGCKWHAMTVQRTARA